MSPPLRIWYGGTYDPVHNGHLAVARIARDRLQAQAWLMPAADPPHKGPTRADATHRLAMLRLAVDGVPGIGVDDRELRRAGPSWTIDTLHELRTEFGPQAPLALLLGADSFLSLPSWKRWSELLEHAHVVVADRPGSGFDADALPAPLASATRGRWVVQQQSLHASPHGCLLRLRMPLRPESSTELRRRIAAGEAWTTWVPAAVSAYIVRHRLYAEPTAILAPTPEDLRP